MATLESDFTGTGNGSVLSVVHGDTFTYTVEGTFVGTVVLEESHGGGNWTAVAGPFTAAASNNYVSRGTQRQHVQYRFRCTAFTSGTVETTLTDVAQAVGVMKDLQGNDVLQATEDGVIIPSTKTLTATTSTITTLTLTTLSACTTATITTLGLTTLSGCTTATITTLGLTTLSGCTTATITTANITTIQACTNVTCTNVTATNIKGGLIDTALTTTVGVGAKNGASVAVVENGVGPIQKTVLTLTATPVPSVSVTTGAGVGGYKIYDFPEGYIRVLGTIADLSVAVGAAKQADFTDNTPEGDIGIGTVAPANADALGTDATDDNLGTASAISMTAWAGTNDISSEAIVDLDGTATAADVYVNALIDAGDIDDDTTTEIEVSGTVTITWINMGDFG